MVTPFLLKEIIDTMVQNPGGHPSPAVIASLSAIVMWWVIVYVVEFTSWRIFDIGLIGIELRVMKDIYLESFNYLQHHSYQFFTNNFSGALVRKVSKLARGYE
jgi:ATP-binding cassette subfamily B protein